MPPQIQIKIKKDGTLETVVNGVAGASCKDVTAWLQSLGSVEEEKPTDDYYKPEDQGIDLQTGGLQ